MSAGAPAKADRSAFLMRALAQSVLLQLRASEQSFLRRLCLDQACAFPLSLTLPTVPFFPKKLTKYFARLAQALHTASTHKCVLAA